MPLKLSQVRPPQPISTPAPAFNTDAATAYNTKSQKYFQDYAPDIKRVLGTSADWLSPDFAKDVYEWQKSNGFTDKWLDGKFGPATMAKMTKVDSTLGKNYDVYAPWKAQHANDKPYKKVADLTSEVDRIRKEMGATDIPLGMLMGWIQVESGGKLDNLTTSAGFRETGLFQISTDEAKAIGADQDKVLQDQDYAIRTGITLARYHAGKLDDTLQKYPTMQKYFEKGSDMYWRMAMLGFSAGDGTVAKLIENMAISNEQFNSWDDVMKFAASHPSGYKHSPIKWAYHINRAFNLGNQMTGIQQPNLAKLVKTRIKNAKLKALKLIAEDI